MRMETYNGFPCFIYEYGFMFMILKYCSVLDNYTVCVDKKLKGCDSQEKLGINIVKDVVDFMCRDSYQGM